ncbi:SAM-dependent methyltransferase [Actinoallomurus purpureus]|uniref:SAM-dependent methyltransferase n=1 Tax=Actinoallomurus purpureus TaxID=478114 RepID=UPI002092DC9A|nr:SAM-dependent methyltransferase [Actinoallomurus purpureus]MCO6004240.1 SAM-dependent methyltransferase [Actinoallomurus purpureus]
MGEADFAHGRELPAGIDVRVAHPARVWNYLLGGKDNFAADREVVDQIRAILPGVIAMAHADEAFRGRAVRYLVGEAGISQFLDIGSGLPASDNTHQVAQAVAPESRVVYGDNDHMVLTHARALLTGDAPGVTDYIYADLHEPDGIVRAIDGTLDLTRPVALMLMGRSLIFLDDGAAFTAVKRLLDAVPAGSHLVITHSTNEGSGEAMDEAVRHWNEFTRSRITMRSPKRFAEFFDGLELVPPGVVPCSRWRPDRLTPSSDGDQFGAIGRKS